MSIRRLPPWIPLSLAGLSVVLLPAAYVAGWLGDWRQAHEPQQPPASAPQVRAQWTDASVTLSWPRVASATAYLSCQLRSCLQPGDPDGAGLQSVLHRHPCHRRHHLYLLGCRGQPRRSKCGQQRCGRPHLRLGLRCFMWERGMGAWAAPSLGASPHGGLSTDSLHQQRSPSGTWAAP